MTSERIFELIIPFKACVLVWKEKVQRELVKVERNWDNSGSAYDAKNDGSCYHMISSKKVSPVSKLRPNKRAFTGKNSIIVYQEIAVNNRCAGRLDCWMALRVVATKALVIFG